MPFMVEGGNRGSSMHRITVADSHLREIPYTDKKGKPARLLVQNAYLHVFDETGAPMPFPERFEVVLPKGQELAYAVGDYTLHPSAIYVDRSGRLACSPRLVPVTKPAKG